MPGHCGIMGGGGSWSSRTQGEQCSASGLGLEMDYQGPYTGSFQARPVNRKRRQDQWFWCSPSFFLHLLTFASAQLTATTLNTRANYQPNTNPIHTKN